MHKQDDNSIPIGALSTQFKQISPSQYRGVKFVVIYSQMHESRSSWIVPRILPHRSGTCVA